MDKISRSERRYHKRRMHNRATKMIQEWYWYSESLTPKELHISAAKRRDHMCVCSCSGCGNQRRNKWNSRNERLTMAERRHTASFVEQMENLDHI